jgi:hypothetical protein
MKAAPWAPTLQSGTRPAGVIGGGGGDCALKGARKRRRGRRHSKVGLDQPALSAVETAIVRWRASESGAVGADTPKWASTSRRYRLWRRRLYAQGRAKTAPWAPTLQSGPRPAGVVGGGDGDCALKGARKRRRGSRHSKAGEFGFPAGARRATLGAILAASVLLAHSGGKPRTT